MLQITAALLDLQPGYQSESGGNDSAYGPAGRKNLCRPAGQSQEGKE